MTLKYTVLFVSNTWHSIGWKSALTRTCTDTAKVYYGGPRSQPIRKRLKSYSGHNQHQTSASVRTVKPGEGQLLIW